MTKEERNRYLEAYYENEADANKQMCFVNAFTGIMMAIIWILYITRAFYISEHMFLIVTIAFPIAILLLITPLFFLKSPRLKKPRFKYFVIFQFILIIAVLNIIVPKHSMIAWALCLAMVNHYYNPKFGRNIFIITLVSMLLCMYLGMFVGEYDPNLLGSGIISGDEIVYPYGIKERFDMLHQLILEGENRYLKVFLYYYIPRAIILTLIFFVSNALNKRTYKLLKEEIMVNSDQQKTQTELEVAKEIQLATLPVEFITSKDIEIQAELKAAKEVGGDFYDYFVLDDDHTAILIADVSGKGIPAAMFMMKTITCFKNFMSVKKSPSQILSEVNATIFKGNDNSMFVTCFLAIINTKTGEVKYANAGHNPPVVGSNQDYHYLKCNSGFVIGAMEKVYVKDETFTLNNGDTITLYTDGITEAKNKDGELYGDERLLNLFNRKEYSCLLELHQQLKDDVIEFVGGEEQSDDMTYITLKYHGDEYHYEECTYLAKLENIPPMLEFLRNLNKKFIGNNSFDNSLSIVADELLSNIVKYAYDGKIGSIYIRYLFNIDKKVLILTIIDTGKAFNPFGVKNGPLEGDAKNYKEGGLGILIVKQIMDECIYDRINDKNIIILKKSFK